MSMYNNRLLFDISESLATDDLAALKFLCLEHIPFRKQEAIQDPKAFFQALREKGLISDSDQAFLKELFYRINRIDILISHLGSSREEMEKELQIPGRAKVSPYRQLLYEIAEDLIADDVNSVKFHLQNQLPKSKLQENASMLMVLMEMERNGIITKDDLTVLKGILKKFRADLKKKIDIYELKTKENVSGEQICSPMCTSVNQAEEGAVGGTEACQFVEAYKMENNPHGYCVILNNYRFKNPQLKREGTIKDGERVKRVFNRLQFETVEYLNLEANQLYAKVEEYSKKDHSNMDCFVCFILSHGEKGKIKGTDEECINIKDILLCFTGSNCPSLAGKPKLFFIQACQGSEIHPHVVLEEDLSDFFLETDAVPPPSIPDRADILLGLSTVQGFESYRSVMTGSVYIQCLCEKLEQLCPLRRDIVAILTEVNKKVASKEINGWKQMPEISSSLRKQVILQFP